MLRPGNFMVPASDDRDFEPYDVVRMVRDPGPNITAAITLPGGLVGFAIALALGHNLLAICSLIPIPLAALLSYATQYLLWKQRNRITPGDIQRMQRQHGACSSVIFLAASAWGVYQILQSAIPLLGAWGASQLVTTAIAITAILALFNRVVIVMVGSTSVAFAMNNVLWHALAVIGACIVAGRGG